ncbi:Secretory lipase [Terriglobus roseus]|uniref:Secretory lipase n=2 Tax=Terriglobus roseus TaxID=392734 RepID=A0A1G7P9L4_9BACT|nr:Secretory lipase [Terriglobus roseus]
MVRVRIARHCIAMICAFLLSSICRAEPGRLISATEISGAPAGAKAWRIRYETSDQAGHVTESTGILVSPLGAAPKEGRNVIAWAHGTTGIAESCAPSQSPHAFSSIPSLDQLVGKGWVVVATDYPGLGTPGPHAYLVGKAAAHAVLDSVRAARHVPKVNASSHYIVWGLSQGAHAALFTGEEAHPYAPELHLVGVAAAAPPTDLTKNLAATGNPVVHTILTAFAAESWSQVYHADLSTILSPMKQRVLHRLAQTCGSEDPALRTKIQVLRLRDLGKIDLSAIEPWRSLLNTNSAGHQPVGAPLFIAQGTKDVVVSPNVTKQFVDEACKRGERVRFMSIPDGVHRTTAMASSTEAIRWMTDLFAGKPASNGCPLN